MHESHLVVMIAWAAMGSLVACAVPRQHALYEPIEAAPEPSAGGNLFYRSKVTASGHWNDRVPELAVDGHHESAGEHWAAEHIPVWLTVDMGAPRELDRIRIWPYWGGNRVYRYHIEGSIDGKTWTMLADASKNDAPGTPDGFTHRFAKTSVRYVRTTLTYNSAGAAPGGHIVEIQGFLGAAPTRWGAVASINERYAGNADLAADMPTTWQAIAWRGERVCGQLLLRAEGEDLRRVHLEVGPLVRDGGQPLAGSETWLEPTFVRYTMAGGKPVGDILDTIEALDIPAGTTRPVWLTLNVPATADAGDYHGKLVARADGGRHMDFDIALTVLPEVLPPPAEWAFHLDLWQNPYAVARYHRVQPWSDAHFAVMRPLLTRLAEAGQKVLTCSIVYEPWGGQTFDPFDSMIGWNRRADGSWTYDFTVFDRWVEFGRSCGLTAQLNCYSMIPWSNRFRYFDEAAGEYATLTASPGTEAYEAHWRPFLAAFTGHLRAKGWLDRTTIAMDERPHKIMAALIAFMKAAAPGLKLSSAVNYPTETSMDIHDLSIAIGHTGNVDTKFLEAREAHGQPTTFYVCCGPGKPNTFTFSPPAESEWQGINAAARGFDGFLRWAYCSWVEDPLMSTDYVRWPSGDCFLVYPGNRSSIRFERLREGIEVYEKIRALRVAAANHTSPAVKQAVDGLNEVLRGVSYESACKDGAEKHVDAVNAAVLKLAQTLAARE